jgi:hypothetical protein
MEFEGPGTTDYENVHSLNRAFLALLRRAAGTVPGIRPPALAARLSALTGQQAKRLAKTPFLLMSFRERDDRFWEPVFADQGSRDLFALPESASDEATRLIAAGLGFVWQLARHNPYAARLICGASLHWCEQLTERTFLHVLALASIQRDILTIRSPDDEELWSKLLDSGVSGESRVRRAAHISALQCVLTGAALPAGKRWSTAACAVRTPVLRVADDGDD